MLLFSTIPYNHQLITTFLSHFEPLQLLETVASALTRSGMHDRAGDFYERLNDLPRALDSYIRGGAFRKAGE